MFDFKEGTLICKKVDVSDKVMNKINTNIMSDVQNSYRKYLNETIYEDVQYLEELLRPAMTNVIFNLKAEVKPLSELTYRKTLINDPIRSYNVNIWSESNGMKLSDSYLFLKIPYMNDYCQLNMNGALKVVKGQMRPAEEISYSMSEKQMNISMRRANIKIGNTGVAKLFIQYNGKKINLYNIIMAMMYKAGDNTRLDSIFKNTYLVNDMKYSPSTSYQIMHDTVISNTGGYNNSILDKYASEQYSLGAARDAINERLDITRGLNHTLSRDIPGTNYHEGDQVTIDMIEDLKHKRINSYCVVSIDLPEDYVSAKTMNFNEIPQGMKNCNLLRAMFPEHASESYIRETISLTEPMVIYEGDRLTKDVLEFLYNGGFRELTVHTGSSKKDITISFEREIVGNYTARLGDLVDDIPAGRSADEWVYYYNNPNLDPVDNDKINCHDFIAIASVYGEILLTGKSPLLDRDSSFLKQILLVNDIFSESLREALKEFVAKYRANIIKALSTSQHQASIDPFKSLTKEWIKKMNAFKYLSPIDSVNLAAEISQVNHVVTQVKDASSVSDAMRHLAMPFYGRICPYETPAGKKLGLVNTKALGCSIRDGIPVTYYRKVLRSDSGGIRISDDVIPMTVKDELGKSFSDLLSFKYDENGNIMNTPILARIPNPESIDEPFIFKNIMAYDLRGGYVQAYPEQFLSPTAALIPFACSNDPVRISFGLSQIRQAIYLLKSQAPLVQTNMYKKFFTYSSNDVYQAPVDGVVTSISNTDFTITYQDEHGMNNHKIVDISGFDYTGGVSATMQVRKHVGDRVKKGDVIVELQKYPQDFVTRAPFDGIVMDVTREQIVFMKKYRNDGTLASWYPLYQTAIANNQRFDPSSIPTNFEDNAIDYIAVSDGHVKGQSVAFSNIHVAPGDFVHEGDILIDTGVSRGGIYSPSRNPLVIYGCYGYNYEDGVCATESASVEYTSVIAHSIEHEISLKKFSNPIASRLRDSKNKTINFKYCKPNDQIGSIKSHGRGRNNDYEQKVFASVKCHGIPFAVGPSDKQTNADTKIYKFHLLGLNKLGSGDKMSGRHGNKGVVSKVLPDSQAPQLKNGMTARFILNPCGVPSRMNIGQILEAHVSLVANITQTTINSDAFNGATTDDVKQLVRFVWDIANDPSIGTIDNLNRSAYDAICARYPYPKEWTDLVWTHMDNVLDWRGVFYPDGTADVYDPETDSYFNGRMLIGFPMYNKLMQEADEKINARAGALEEEYSYTNSQPNKGSHSAKGQRMAEMELMALAALGTSHFIDEVINDKSDNSGRRQNNTWNQLDINGSDFNPVVKEACYSRSVENLLYFFEAMGVKAETTPDVCDISQEATMVKHDLNLRKFVRDRIKPVRDISSSTPRYSPEDIISAFDDMDD